MTPGRLENILISLGIQYRVMPKAINICCPFCVGSTHGRRDEQFRCGIFNSSLTFHCFRCKRKGTFYKLLRDMLGMSLSDYRALVGSSPSPGNLSTVDTIRQSLAPAVAETAPRKTVSLPASRPVGKELVQDHPLLGRFLKDRNISLQTCADYRTRYTGDGGDYPQRFIIPVLDEEGELAAWQARDVTGRSDRKYLTEGDVSQLLYRIPFRYPYRIYVVEGVLDCWRMEHTAVATFSHAISSIQRRLLLSCGADEIVFAWDGDSFAFSLRAAEELAPIIRAGAVQLPDGMDPDRAGAETVRSLPVRWI